MSEIFAHSKVLHLIRTRSKYEAQMEGFNNSCVYFSIGLNENLNYISAYDKNIITVSLSLMEIPLRLNGKSPNI